ncbi:hypothetical protein [Mycoplasma anserisalpingitidis]|uniref:hypothetical protein n=1 Tax=Mycoplasma anserisalpingitidis TaxID=519450 RepID=UPI001CF679A2|nr:hypothetical protein [Mycoplasma anserisalpingitidis]UCU26697.1 hypothetical protein K7D06_03835 [Mycoplasma anserisalpingitidis]UCU27535.1 hypothetical protein K9O38_00625 [Mycoplasma anserisalpingitidis]
MSKTNKKSLKLIIGLLLAGSAVTVGSCIVTQKMIEKESLKRAYAKNFEINQVRRDGLRDLINKLDDTEEHKSRRDSLLNEYSNLLTTTTDPKKLKTNNDKLQSVFEELSKEIDPLYNVEKEKLENVYQKALDANALYDEMYQIKSINVVKNSKDWLENKDNAITIQKVKDETVRMAALIANLQEFSELRTKIKSIVSFDTVESSKAKKIIDAALNKEKPTYKNEVATSEIVKKILDIKSSIELKNSKLTAFEDVEEFTDAQKSSINKTISELNELYENLQNL